MSAGRRRTDCPLKSRSASLSLNRFTVHHTQLARWLDAKGHEALHTSGLPEGNWTQDAVLNELSVRDLPDYGIAGIRTGQYLPATGVRCGKRKSLPSWTGSRWTDPVYGMRRLTLRRYAGFPSTTRCIPNLRHVCGCRSLRWTGYSVAPELPRGTSPSDTPLSDSLFQGTHVTQPSYRHG